MTTPLWLCRVAALALAVFPLIAPAGQFGVAPVRLGLSDGHRVESLQVTNQQGEPLTVQIEAFAWTQQDGEDKLTATREIVISPPILRLDANASSRIRVGLRHPGPSAREQSFRLLVSEILAPATAPSAPVQFRTRMSLPLFVAPEAGTTTQERLQWTRHGDDLAITNLGSIHAQISDLLVRGDGLKASIPLPKLGYLLPGATRRWPLPEAIPDDAQLIITTHRGEARGPLVSGP